MQSLDLQNKFNIHIKSIGVDVVMDTNTQTKYLKMALKYNYFTQYTQWHPTTEI